MDLRSLIFTATLVVAAPALATGTGPTLPGNSREHPLDNREPRQDVIDAPGERESRPPTLEAPPGEAPPLGTPPERPPLEPVKPRPQRPEPGGFETSGRALPVHWTFD